MSGDGSFGERLRSAREARKLSPSELARRVGVTPTAVWNWENQGIVARRDTLAKLARELGVSEAFLLAGKMGGAEVPSQNVASIVAEAREKIAAVTGYPINSVKLHLEFIIE